MLDLPPLHPSQPSLTCLRYPFSTLHISRSHASVIPSPPFTSLALMLVLPPLHPSHLSLSCLRYQRQEIKKITNKYIIKIIHNFPTLKINSISYLNDIKIPYFKNIMWQIRKFSSKQYVPKTYHNYQAFKIINQFTKNKSAINLIRNQSSVAFNN